MPFFPDRIRAEEVSWVESPGAWGAGVNSLGVGGSRWWSEALARRSGRGLKRKQGLPGTGGTSSVRAGEPGGNIVRVSRKRKGSLRAGSLLVPRARGRNVCIYNVCNDLLHE